MTGMVILSGAKDLDGFLRRFTPQDDRMAVSFGFLPVPALPARLPDGQAGRRQAGRYSYFELHAMKIVGIDPGTNRIGYAAIEGDRHALSLISAETIVIPPKTPRPQRLARLAQALETRLARDRPGVVAVEELFFTRNAKTAIAVAEARGVILLTAQARIRSIWEYTPLEVKQAVSGYGRSEKDAIRRMVRRIFPQSPLPPGDDAIDAIAIALAAMYRGDPRGLERV